MCNQGFLAVSKPIPRGIDQIFPVSRAKRSVPGPVSTPKFLKNPDR